MDKSVEIFKFLSKFFSSFKISFQLQMYVCFFLRKRSNMSEV